MTVDQVASADETWLVEHRLHSVLEVRGGAPVAEVAARYGASPQSVYRWKARYERDGVAGLHDRSRRPRSSPGRIPAEVEALVCELRRAHPRWGARRLVFELSQGGVERVPSKATVHRALVRNGLVNSQQQTHKRKYRRWQRETPMHLREVRAYEVRNSGLAWRCDGIRVSMHKFPGASFQPIDAGDSEGRRR